ncbi:PH domain-containing protein [Streptomyces sp. JJ66]|uniref:PH domain-containing protein n=1 Tax=Streptomyces sp. JJ66 TaxID=2803843 RepID=UPI001C59B23C|nr:PH domain-containing protein [Streptomyces sp. JJ66]MBW1604366.1 PH domain-containing protein [Streptomyces sp. JJ66]
MTSEQEPQYADRRYRPWGAVASGVILLAITLWLGGEAVLSGEGRTPLTAAAALLCAVPLIVAFTLRPAVYAGAERLLVRNPFRTITVPWGAVDAVRARYSTELLADGQKYQLWALPVSLRARRSAQRHNARLAAGETPGKRGLGLLGGPVQPQSGVRQSPSDEAVSTLQKMAEENAAKTGPVSVRWAYEIIAPAALGALAALMLVITG